MLIVENRLYLANVGDSRALLSLNGGRNFLNISRDHKPSDEREQNRIISAGGRIYQSKKQVKGLGGKMFTHVGPQRVFPGRLSVSRAFGNVSAKDATVGGIPNVVIALPEIYKKVLDSECDFMVICTDGVYDRLQNEEVLSAVWSTLESRRRPPTDAHSQCGIAAKAVLETALRAKTGDNISSIVISLSGFSQAIKNKIQSKTNF